MELRTAMKERRSIRKFTEQPVSAEVLEELIKQSFWAPSGVNAQEWKFIVLQGGAFDKFLEYSKGVAEEVEQPLEKQGFNEKMRAFVKGYFRDLGGASTAVVCLYKKHQNPTIEHSNQVSAAVVMYNFLLLAHEAGLATCWMTGYLYNEEASNRALDLGDYRLVGVTPVGYPAQTPPVPPRKHESIEWKK